MVFLAIYLLHENPDLWGISSLNAMKRWWRDPQIFMVNEYFHIHRAFMAMKIMNPSNSKPWKCRFYFHDMTHSPLITHEILDLASINFHGIFKGIWWVLHNARLLPKENFREPFGSQKYKLGARATILGAQN